LPDKKNKTKLPTLEEKPKRSNVFILLKLMRRARNPRLLATVVLYVAVCGALLPRFFGGISMKLGGIAASDIESPNTIRYMDKEATEAARQAAAEKVMTIYRLPENFQSNVANIFKTVLDYLDSNGGAAARTAAVGKLSSIGLTTDTIHALLELKNDQPVQLRLKTNAVIERLTSDGLLDAAELRNLSSAVLFEGVDPALVPAVQDILMKSAGPLVVDSEATAFRRREAMSSVQPIMGSIQKNEMVVRKGEKIAQRHLDILRDLGLLKTSLSWTRIFGYAILIAFSFFVVAVYLKTFAIRFYRDEKRLLIFYIIVLLSVLWAVMISETPIFSKYLIGVSAGMMTILTCLLLSPMTAMFSVPVLLLVVSVVLGLDTGHFLVALFAYLAAYFHAVRTQDRDSMFKAGVTISLSSMAIILVLTLVKFPGIKQALMDVVLFGGLTGMLSFMIAMGLLPMFERLFNVTTPHRLLELSNPEEPLLKRLLIEAPGSYHHSILVGNLAESAAEAVGADALLVRIACYYHDVGKLKRPYFFIENQIHGVSQLSDMAPTLAALVISSHVKDGVEMAQENALPDEIVDIITEHHGSCLISFFYQQAQAEAKDGAGLHEERFRYPGPKPSRIESAIVMLADSCEAAIRSQKAPTPKSIEGTVNSIFETRLMDGQFDDCNVTLKQLGDIKTSLMKTLARVYHSRMEYPDLEELKAHKDHAARKNGDH
jgi:cyclic-di-AMP phosphodiesterase PgpH